MTLYSLPGVLQKQYKRIVRITIGILESSKQIFPRKRWLGAPEKSIPMRFSLETVYSCYLTIIPRARMGR